MNDVILTQAALGGTLTFLVLETAEHCTWVSAFSACAHVSVCVSVSVTTGGRGCVYTWLKFPWQMWSEHHLDLGMSTRKTPVLQLRYYSFSTNMCFQSQHSVLFFLCSFTMSLENNVLCFAHLCLSLCPQKRFWSVESFAGAQLSSCQWGFFRCCYISGCYCWPSCSLGKIFSPFPKRYNPHTHHTISDPCLHDTWQVHCGACVWACKQELMCAHLCVCMRM